MLTSPIFEYLNIWHTRPLARQLTLTIDHTLSHEINNHNLLLFQHQITLHFMHEIVVHKYFHDSLYDHRTK